MVCCALVKSWTWAATALERTPAEGSACGCSAARWIAKFPTVEHSANPVDTWIPHAISVKSLRSVLRLPPPTTHMRLICLPVSTGISSYTHLRAHETRHDLVCRL